MKNITISVDEQTYRRARIKAAEQDTSVSGLVRDYLRALAGEETDFESRKRQERALMERIETFSGSDRLSRDAVHERAEPRGRQRR